MNSAANMILRRFRGVGESPPSPSAWSPGFRPPPVRGVKYWQHEMLLLNAVLRNNPSILLAGATP